MAFKKLRAASERIAFQATGAYAKEISAAFSRLDSDMDTNCAVPISSDNPSLHLDAVLVKEYVSGKRGAYKKHLDEIRSITSKYTGMRVNLAIDPHAGTLGYVFPTLKISKRPGLEIFDMDNVFQTMNTSVKWKSSSRNKKVKTIFEDLSNGFDQFKGGIPSGVDEALSFNVVLGYILFNSKYYKFNKQKSLTIEEITAVYLHEVGHAVTFAEAAALSFRNTLDGIESISLLTDSGDRNEAVNLADGVAAELPAGAPKAKKLISKVKLSDSSKTGEITTAVSGHIAVQQIMDLATAGSVALLAATLVSAATLYTSINKTLATHIVSEIFQLTTASKNGASKTADTFNIGKMAATAERSADEYVARLGYGKHLVGALTKIRHVALMPEQIALKDNPAEKYAALGDVACIGGILISMYKVLWIKPAHIPELSEYDEELQRIMEIVNSNMSIFKNRDLPVEIRNEWLDQTESLIRQYEAYKKETSEPVRNFVWHTIFRLGNLPHITGALFHGNILQDYVKLQEYTRGLIRTRLHYYGAQIQRLIDERSSPK